MRKKLLLIPAFALFLSCHKNGTTSGCGMQVCNDIFKQIDVVFVEKTGNPVPVSNLTAVDQRTSLPLQWPNNLAAVQRPAGTYLLADDSMRGQLSTKGDDVLVTATNPTTNQTKSTLYTVSGGCNCHVEKITGPDTIRFDQ